MKKPKWLRWDSSDADDDLKKVRRQTDQRIKQQEAQKEQQDGAKKKNQSPSISSARDRHPRQRLDSCGNPSDFQPHRVDRRGHRE